MSDLTGNAAKALEAFKAGQDVNEAVGMEPAGGSHVSEESQPLDTDSTMETLGLSGQESEPSTSSESDDVELESQPSEETTSTTDVEEVFVTDHNGRKKVKIDYGDRDKIKKMFQFAHGARKWQVAKDKAEKELTQLRESVKSDATAKENFQALETAYEQRGLEGLVDLLEGREGAYQTHFQKEIQKHEYRQSASPEELELMDSKEREASRLKEFEQLRRENEEFRSKVEKDKEQAEFHAMESKVHPAFDKYRFAGKLGDVNDEHLFDEMLWNSSLKRLEPYEEKGVAITPNLVDKAFRQTSMAIRKRINVQANKEVKKAVNKKKREATTATQTRVMKGIKSSSEADEAKSMIRGNDLTGLLKNWGKYGSLFSK